MSENIVAAENPITNETTAAFSRWLLAATPVWLAYSKEADVPEDVVSAETKSYGAFLDADVQSLHDVHKKVQLHELLYGDDIDQRERSLLDAITKDIRALINMKRSTNKPEGFENV